MWDKTAEEAELELKRLEKLVKVAKGLFRKAKLNPSEEAYPMALAGVLNSFYIGVENIFRRIALEIDGGFKQSVKWHKDLLESMTRSNDNRSEVLSEPPPSKLGGF